MGEQMLKISGDRSGPARPDSAAIASPAHPRRPAGQGVDRRPAIQSMSG
jgi:hypothetical protein